MIDFDGISLKVTGSDKDEKGNVISDFIIEKGVLTRYVITWTKHDIVGDKKGTDCDFRDSTMETHIRNPEFEKKLKVLIEAHFVQIKSFENIITGK
ncbi:MAG TPA: hypothetical protein VMW09_10475 [Desulfatiglandales bacterium]|nr:hypothetical protein [Desulfatiglandales bacterium]